MALRDEAREDRGVNISQATNVEAASPDLVGPKLLEESGVGLEAAHEIQGKSGLARREGDWGPDAAPTAAALVDHLAIPHDSWPPHRWGSSGGLAEEGSEGLGVLTAVGIVE
jgi:hypothetical protein